MLAWRDSDGVLSDRLPSMGAYADGCIDMGEESELMADAMTGHGLLAAVRSLADPASSPVSPAEGDLALLARDVLALSGG